MVMAALALAGVPDAVRPEPSPADAPAVRERMLHEVRQQSEENDQSVVRLRHHAVAGGGGGLFPLRRARVGVVKIGAAMVVLVLDPRRALLHFQI